MNINHHPYHLVDVRPWPIIGAVRVINIIVGTIKIFHIQTNFLIILGATTTILIMYQWWRDIVRERTFQGLHSIKVIKGLKWGMILFITSEVIFFVSFFWAFIHRRASPNIELGINWPPLGIKTFNILQVPLLNTVILISSGVSITWAHHALLNNNHQQTKNGLLITVILGLYFTILQAFEYYEASFNISDSIYGATFFIATGFHGVHVIIGTTFIIVCLIRHINNHFSKYHHFGFEAAAWYWHFVDVVWLFLYILVYWWGG